MGLDIVCNNISARVGSYSSVHVLRYNLLIAIKKYLENMIKNYKAEIPNGQEFEDEETTNKMADLIIAEPLVEYLNELTENNQINYDAFNKEKNNHLGFFDLDGFMTFIEHSDCDGSYDDANDFIKTYDLVKDYVDENYKNEDNSFYLDEVFNESAESGTNIYFC